WEGHPPSPGRAAAWDPAGAERRASTGCRPCSARRWCAGAVAPAVTLASSAHWGSSARRLLGRAVLVAAVAGRRRVVGPSGLLGGTTGVLCPLGPRWATPRTRRAVDARGVGIRCAPQSRWKRRRVRRRVLMGR